MRFDSPIATNQYVYYTITVNGGWVVRDSNDEFAVSFEGVNPPCLIIREQLRSALMAIALTYGRAGGLNIDVNPVLINL